MKRKPKKSPLYEKLITNTKLLTWVIVAGCAAAYIYILIGWRAGCTDSAMMSTGPLVLAGIAIAVNGLKSGYENGKKIDGPMNKRVVKAIINAGATALTSGNPASAASSFLQTMESEDQQIKMEQQEDQQEQAMQPPPEIPIDQSQLGSNNNMAG